MAMTARGLSLREHREVCHCGDPQGSLPEEEYDSTCSHQVQHGEARQNQGGIVAAVNHGMHLMESSQPGQLYDGRCPQRRLERPQRHCVEKKREKAEDLEIAPPVRGIPNHLNTTMEPLTDRYHHQSGCEGQYDKGFL
eukprot:CAMPEP_0197626406 /NCGR_PEP_ID=MMETSP1338-20131121/5391_1 /TAXON_ID=43686 ORGANISM="Pelagodinium beii, Strain RCC1491" /NCGR_SAMPLE_ID=MMETSP1338 /ASSEMBLY_ACC=CAM_ASM_000754 /LENGTH=137 /DNA_ID=CAMNT_0043196947 /DNA_START=170 /DNA_END=583 /DNA_ORIENTATION=+